MSRLRILLLAPFCDPDAVSMPYVAYAHAAALAEIHDVTLVIGAPVEGNVRRAQGRFNSIEVVRTPSLERIYEWSLRKIFKYNFDTQMLTAFGYPFFLAFEWTAWRHCEHEYSHVSSTSSCGFFRLRLYCRVHLLFSYAKAQFRS